jgi:hypothetical protein
MTATKKQLERGAALARMEAEEVADAVARLHAAMSDASSADHTVRAQLEEVRAASARLQQVFDEIHVGLTVAQAAERLDVSVPTVHKWIRESLLEALPERSPTEVTQHSVIRAERILENVRVAYPARQWTRALAAYLHDRDLQRQDWFEEGAAALGRGERVKL